MSSEDVFTEGVAVVTGAASSMGRSMALAIARAGAAVVIADIDERAANSVKEQIVAAGGRAIAVATDVTREADLAALAECSFSEFGKVTLLVNHAGGGVRPYREIWDASLADIEWTMQINFWAMAHSERYFIPRWLDQPGRKHIVNTSSMISLMRIGGHGLYAPTKGAIDGLSNSLRQEGEVLNFGVTLLCPGYFQKQDGPTEQYRRTQAPAAARQVKPWSDYVDGFLRANPDVPRHPVTGGILDPLTASLSVSGDVATVGPMVVDAVKANRPYCFTHPVPQELLDQRARECRDAYHLV